MTPLHEVLKKWKEYQKYQKSLSVNDALQSTGIQSTELYFWLSSCVGHQDAGNCHNDLNTSCIVYEKAAEKLTERTSKEGRHDFKSQKSC
jgi:hypothetical protein